VALAGDPGIGKTTVANLVAAHPAVKEEFQQIIVVSGVGRIPNLRAAFTTMWKALPEGGGEEPDWLTHSAKHPEDARKELKNLLQPSTRTLLLLDDVWCPEAVQRLNICTADPHKMLVTSRDLNILANTEYRAEYCRLFQSELRLCDHHALRILARKVLRSQPTVGVAPDASQVVGKDLMRKVRKKCKNNPLALEVREHLPTAAVIAGL
jgi:hypothetical protein